MYAAQGAESEVVSFMTIPVVLSCGGQRVNAVALMDPASSMSFVRQDVAARLGAENAADHDVSVTVLGGGLFRESRQRIQVYADDLLGSAANDDTAIKLHQEVQGLLHEGSFHLRKWRSNSVAVLESIPKEDRAQNAMMCLEQKTDSLASTVKALGVAWDASNDTFTFSYQPPDIPS